AQNRRGSAPADRRRPSPGTSAESWSLLVVKLVGRDLDIGDDAALAAAHRREEARAPPCVAGNAGLVHQHQEAIVVAIDAQLDQSLHLARGLALAPQAGARARPVADA